MLELLLPRRCAGCAAPGQGLCADCRHLLRQPPARVFTPVDPHVPVHSLGPYTDARRAVIIAVKERGNLAVRRPLGAVLAAAVTHLQARGELPDRLVLVPAPTRSRSARLRGGDHVTDLCRASGLPVTVALRHGAQVADQVGLDAAARRRNLAGRVELLARPRAPVLLVDDVVTTGSTLAAATETLVAAGAHVAAALVFAHA